MNELQTNVAINEEVTYVHIHRRTREVTINDTPNFTNPLLVFEVDQDFIQIMSPEQRLNADYVVRQFSRNPDQWELIFNGGM